MITITIGYLLGPITIHHRPSRQLESVFYGYYGFVYVYPRKNCHILATFLQMYLLLSVWLLLTIATPVQQYLYKYLNCSTFSMLLSSIFTEILYCSLLLDFIAMHFVFYTFSYSLLSQSQLLIRLKSLFTISLTSFLIFPLAYEWME